MKRNHLFVVLVAITFIILSCGGGGGSAENNDSTIVPPIVFPPIVNYITDKMEFTFSEGDFFSEKGAMQNLQTKKIAVPQDGEAYQAMKTWGNFPIKKGDLYAITINGDSSPAGREVTLKIKNSAGNITYAEEKFIFQGKKVVNLSVDADDNGAKMHLMLGEKTGEYTFLDDILVERRRVVSDKKPKLITIDPLTCKFIVEKDLGSTRSSNGEITAKTGKERWSTILKCDNVSIEEGKIYKFITSGHSLPANEVIFKLESSIGQSFGERTVELFGDKLVFEIVPTGKDALGKLAIFFPEAGIYHPGPITIEVSD